MMIGWMIKMIEIEKTLGLSLPSVNGRKIMLDNDSERASQAAICDTRICFEVLSSDWLTGCFVGLLGPLTGYRTLGPGLAPTPITSQIGPTQRAKIEYKYQNQKDTCIFNYFRISI